MPIPNAEILAWSTLTGIRPSRWELMALRALDRCYLKIAAETL